VGDGGGEGFNPGRSVMNMVNKQKNKGMVKPDDDGGWEERCQEEP
jgi:hypothetical protein